MTKAKPPRSTRQCVASRSDLHLAEFDGERLLRAQLASMELKEPEDDALAEALDDLSELEDAPTRGSRLKNEVRLSRKLAPGVWRAVDACSEFLAVTDEIEIYVSAETGFQASVEPYDGRRVTISVSPRMVEAFSHAELVFVLGHELAHVIFDHSALRDVQKHALKEYLAPVDAMRFYAWTRYGELTADRVGLLCCDDLEAAVTAQFKLVSGIGDSRAFGDLMELADQLGDADADELASTEDDWLNTHPHAPLRVRALNLFWKSQTHATLRGRPTTASSADQARLERDVASVMKLMNPVCLDQERPEHQEICELVALAGIEVALADGSVSDAEKKAVRRFSGLTDLPIERRDRAPRIDELCERMKVQLRRIERKRIIEDLTAIGHADDTVTEAELEVLVSIAEKLDVERSDVECAIAQLGWPHEESSTESQR